MEGTIKMIIIQTILKFYFLKYQINNSFKLGYMDSQANVSAV